MTARAKLHQVLDSGDVVQVRPAMLSVRDAAAYTAVSESKLNALRSSDAKALREGRAPEGPPWVALLGTMIRYRVSDLDAWLARSAKALGVVDAYRGDRESTP